MVKFRNTKSGEARGIKPKVKYRLQMCWVMPASEWCYWASSAIFCVMLLVPLVPPSRAAVAQAAGTLSRLYDPSVSWVHAELGKSGISSITPSMSYDPKLIWCFKIAPKIRKHPRVSSVNWIAYVFLKNCSSKIPPRMFCLQVQTLHLSHRVLYRWCL